MCNANPGQKNGRAEKQATEAGCLDLIMRVCVGPALNDLRRNGALSALAEQKPGGRRSPNRKSKRNVDHSLAVCKGGGMREMGLETTRDG